MEKVKSGSILIVDDDPSVLDSSSIISATSAEEAINKLHANSIDVVVTDIVMPVTSGIELLRQVHDIDPQIPVILMTAYADIDKVIDALKIGAYDFIIKPFTADLLFHSVEKAVHYTRLIQMEKDYKRLLEEFSREIETLVTERTMSLMALTIADKVRNPSSVIGLTCKRILEKEDVPEKLKPKLMDILREAEKLDDIVKDFHSLLKNKKSLFQYEDINGVIKSVIPMIENLATSKGIDLEFQPSGYPLKTNMDKHLFQIALTHLIKNSIEATPEGGRITISTREEENNILLMVSDTGYGISIEDREKIFDPMFSTKEQRFGMGLALVKGIVGEHMGDISVESEPGEYTNFRIRLPMRWMGK
jgi:signal transduction histidine kinase